MDVDTRLLRALVAVAAEGSVTRAAARLHLSQPALSKQLRRLEELVGAELLVRGKHGVGLTPSGTALQAAARTTLAEWDSGVRHVGNAHRSERPSLTVGFVANAAAELTPAIAQEFARSRPEWELQFEQTDWSDPTAGLADGRSDVAFVRLPLPDDSALHVQPLVTEPMCIAVPVDHWVADRSEIRVADVAEEPFVATRGPEAWRDWWLATGLRDGCPVNVGATVGTPDEWLAAILAGRGVGFAFASAARYYAPPGIVYVSVVDLPPSTVAVAWRRSTRSDAVDVFVSACRGVAEPLGHSNFASRSE